MSLEKEKRDQNKELINLLKENHKAELSNILAFWEKYRKKWEEVEREFWSKNPKSVFDRLVLQYDESRKNFEKRFQRGFLLNKKVYRGFNSILKDKFYEEYLFNLILYSWDKDKWTHSDSKEFYCDGIDFDYFMRWVSRNKGDLKPWTSVDLSQHLMWDKWVEILVKWWKNYLKLWLKIFLRGNIITDEWAKIIAKEWKDRLQVWMTINLRDNYIWDEGLEVIAKEWKDCLQPGMYISLSWNNIWDNGVNALVKNWKDSLKPWMSIMLEENTIWINWARVLVDGWKDSLKPWLTISLFKNEIGPELANVVVDGWKDKLQPLMEIDLWGNNIWDEWVDLIINNLELKEWVMIRLDYKEEWKEKVRAWVDSYKRKWIHCKVSLWNLVID